MSDNLHLMGQREKSSGKSTSLRGAAKPKRVLARDSTRRSERAGARRVPKSVVAHESKLSDVLTSIVGHKKVSAAGLSALLVKSGPAAVSGLRDALDNVIASSSGLDPEIWGPDPLQQDLDAARKHGAQIRHEVLDAALADAWSRDEVAAHLGISPQAVSKQAAGSRLASIKRAGQHHFPSWQFTDDGVVVGVFDLTKAFVSPIALTSWVTTPSVDLGGQTPAEELRTRHGLDRVRELLVSVGPAAW